MNALKQAVILCGGLGTRLRPLTLTTPKPMVKVGGRPFLHSLLEQVKSNGITEVILLTGYLGDKIKDYFGSGSALGINIKYSQGPEDWDTGRRLFEAKSLLKNRFLLLYSDNFAQFNLSRTVDVHSQSGCLLTFMVTLKPNGNIRLCDNGMVGTYDKTRSKTDLNYVELGYMLVEKGIFTFFENKDCSFSDIITKLVDDKKVYAYINKEGYHSISDPHRMALMEEYLKPKKILLIDRDGVINEKALRGEYITTWDEFRFIDDTVECLKRLSADGYKFIIISNQAGIGRGVVTREAVDNINNKMKYNLNKMGVEILKIYVCPHHWEDKCFCRKPNPGMFFKASRDFSLRLDKAYFVGDDPRDCIAAYNAGCRAVFLGHRALLKGLPRYQMPAIVTNTLADFCLPGGEGYE